MCRDGNLRILNYSARKSSILTIMERILFEMVAFKTAKDFACMLQTIHRLVVGMVAIPILVDVNHETLILDVA